jgi:pyrimidine-specific ribonucleoside hydrolase
LFDVVQPWMEKNEKYFGVRGFILWLFDFSDNASRIFYVYYKDIPIKVNYRKMMRCKYNKCSFKNFLEVSYKYKSKRR